MEIEVFHLSKHLCTLSPQQVYVLASLLYSLDVIKPLNGREYQGELLHIRLSALRLSSFVSLSRATSKNYDSLIRSLKQHEQNDLSIVQKHIDFGEFTEVDFLLFTMTTQTETVQKPLLIEHFVFLNNMYSALLQYYQTLLKSPNIRQDYAMHLQRTYTNYANFQEFYQKFIRCILSR